ncbi:hypothetical protein G7Y89_g11317 [Cudoniella acicularis]|uniref:FAD linked oxidase N-terminal domain-containing protein n=1 Tax=Cudoniella acicularis TaxID=354080 RepID=A0A8H4RB45_9HELO|nr:hypothetical protein G7Y89_g11317 [Cudoniella acicularis]
MIMAPTRHFRASAIFFLLFNASVIAAADVQSAFTVQCSSLSALLPGKVFFLRNAKSNASLQSYFSAQEASIAPFCIVIPTFTHDISSAVQALAAFHTFWPAYGIFAVRSGGHTPFASAANIAGGVTIDLNAMKKISLSTTDKSVLSVSPGAHWIDVYSVLDPLQMTVVGGRGASIGVGGFLLDGGISFLSPSLG